MKCRNCGADIPSEALSCPYCGTENLRGISFFKRMKEKREENRKLKESILEQTRESYINKMLNRILIISGLAFFLLLFFNFTLYCFSSGTHLFKPADRVNKMKQLCEKEEYNQLYRYMSDYDLFGEENYEYSRIALIANHYAYYTESRNTCVELLRKGKLPSEYEIERAIEDGIDVLYPSIPAYREAGEEDSRITAKQSIEVEDFFRGVFGFGADEFDIIKSCGEDGWLNQEDEAVLYEKAVSSLKKGGAVE